MMKFKSNMFFNISFDKEKLHNFFKKEVSYSDIINKEIVSLPIF